MTHRSNIGTRDSALNIFLKDGFPRPLFQSLLYKRLFRFFLFFFSPFVFHGHFSTRFQFDFNSTRQTGVRFSDIKRAPFLKYFHENRCRVALRDATSLISRQYPRVPSISPFEIKLFPIANDAKRDLAFPEEVVPSTRSNLD